MPLRSVSTVVSKENCDARGRAIRCNLRWLPLGGNKTEMSAEDAIKPKKPELRNGRPSGPGPASRSRGLQGHLPGFQGGA